MDGGSGDDSGSGIEVKLKFMLGFMWKTQEEGGSVINTGKKQGVDENSGEVWCEGRVEAIDVV